MTTPDPDESLLDKHFREVGMYDQPTAEEEHQSFTAYAAARAKADMALFAPERERYEAEATTLAKHIATWYLRFVIREAKRKRRRDDPRFPDLITEGYKGLMRAIEKFDPARKVDVKGKDGRKKGEKPIRFLSYATNWINVFQNDFLRKGDVHVPNHSRKTAGTEAKAPPPTISVCTLDNVILADDSEVVEQAVANKHIDVMAWLVQSGVERLDRWMVIRRFGLRHHTTHEPEGIAQLLYELDGTMLPPEMIATRIDKALGQLREYLVEEGVGGLEDVLFG